MPIGAYFHGHGTEVMANMQDQYGADKAKQVFYAVANKKGENPPEKKSPKKPKYQMNRKA